MSKRPFNIAIETTTRSGSVSLGRNNVLLESITLHEYRRGMSSPLDVDSNIPGNRLDLMPTIDALTNRHGVDPSQLGEIYVSVGPGSFTGLRIAIATAKALAQTLSTQLVAVSTLEAVVQNTPADIANNGYYVAVCLNLKRESMYTQIFTWCERGWQADSPPALRSLRKLIDTSPRPLAVIGDPVPDIPDHDQHGVTLLPPELAIAQSSAVWKLGQLQAQQGCYTDPQLLVPLYARPPEAQELWEQRHHTPKKPSMEKEAAR